MTDTQVAPWVVCPNCGVHYTPRTPPNILTPEYLELFEEGLRLRREKLTHESGDEEPASRPPRSEG